jgi:hypothetical protein
MRILLVMAWLLVPVGFSIWHYGPGQDRMKIDDAGRLLAKGDRLAADESWEEAIEAYDAALALLPPEQVDASRRVRLAKAKAQMQGSLLSEAHGALRALCEELQADQGADRALLADARSTMASAHYYLTWVMRLEGLPREMWEPEIETARQTYRLLAEQAGERGDETGRVKYEEDLESAVRLARMDLGELQGLALPKQCCGCCSGKCASRGNKGQKPGKRDKDARGASSGAPPDTSGH